MIVFFFKQKTAYEMRISDWSSDVCSSDLSSAQPTTSPSAQVVVQSADATPAALPRMTVHKNPTCGCCGAWIDHVQKAGVTVAVDAMDDHGPVKERLGVPYATSSSPTGRAEVRERVCNVVSTSVVAG